MLQNFALAARAAGSLDDRRYRLGVVAIRGDGVLVSARNGHPVERDFRHHAEARIARKLTPGAVLYIVRLGMGGAYRLARPCVSCQNRLRSAGAARIYYTISEVEYGVLHF